MAKARKPVLHSEAVHPEGSQKGKPHPEDRLQVRVVLRPSPLPEDHPIARKVAELESRLPHERSPLEDDELEELHRADDDHIKKVVDFAKEHGLEVKGSSRLRHDVVVAGTVAAINAAFGVELEHFEHQGRTHRGHRGAIHLPEDLHEIVMGVVGLDDIPRARRFSTGPSVPAGGVSFSPQRIAELYGFPEDVHGEGERIAILAFDGGFHWRDLRKFFADSMPEISTASVHGEGGESASNDPLDHSRLGGFIEDFNDPEVDFNGLIEAHGADLQKAMATFEVTMDVQIAGAIAPAARIDVYFAPNHVAGWVNAIYAALGVDPEKLKDGAVYHEGDTALPHQRPTVISLSWGNAEWHWGDDMGTIHAALELAKHMGVTVCCASGDYGSRCWPPSPPAPPEPRARNASVSFPASSPWALAVGGTTLSVGRHGTIGAESVWNRLFKGVPMATGGGVSGEFELPGYQTGLRVPSLSDAAWIDTAFSREEFRGRGVPDVAAVADAATGYELIVGGRAAVGGGTSASTPVWAALIALLNEKLSHRVGWLTPLLYRPDFRGAFREIAGGNNDVAAGELPYFSAHAGWNACTGLGSPIGTKLLDLLSPPA